MALRHFSNSLSRRFSLSDFSKISGGVSKSMILSMFEPQEGDLAFFHLNFEELVAVGFWFFPSARNFYIIYFRESVSSCGEQIMSSSSFLTRACPSSWREKCSTRVLSYMQILLSLHKCLWLVTLRWRSGAHSTQELEQALYRHREELHLNSQT